MRLHRSTPIWLTSALVLALSAPISGQHFPADDVVQSIIDERVAAGGAVGIALGLMESDGSTRVFTAGRAGEGGPPLDARTLFEIGSITKVFTGTLLADMARRGEVALDDPVRVYLPDGVSAPTRNGREITLEDLATHRSGLPRLPANMAPADPANPYVDYTPQLLYDFLSSYDLPRDIGAEVEYSNLGVGLLGFLLSGHLEMTYEEAVRERILAPLAMELTGIELRGPMAALMAKGHDPGGTIVPLWDVATLAGAGGIRSNVEDMLGFLAANVGEPTSDLERAMRDAHTPRESMGGPNQVGLNWITRAGDGSRIVWHNGGTAGFRTFAGFDPDAEAAVVVLTNSGIGADDIGIHLLDQTVPLAPPALPEFAQREAVDVAPEVLERYVGVYRLAPGMEAQVELQDGRLRTQLTGQPWVDLFPASETLFFIRVVAAELDFQVDETGGVTRFILRQNGQTIPAEKIR
ncbi:MAG: serine hydrolase [Gemmatimonadetes bacterium]|nr:serine hydrolase [Gemmatimonadota bacterium]